MGLRQVTSEMVGIVKDALGFGPGFPDALAAHRLEFTHELDRLQHVLEDTQRACAQRDELIAKLQAAVAIASDIVADESAYYIQKDGVLDGPFCTSCFQQNHEMARIEPAPRPAGAGESSADCVQCAKCRIPFQSDRISRRLTSAGTPPALTAVCPDGTGQAESVKPTPKSRTRSRRVKKSPSQ